MRSEKEILKEILDGIHARYLEKAETSIINGTELTVLPYGYLQGACKEAINEFIEIAMSEYTLHIVEQAVDKEVLKWKNISRSNIYIVDPDDVQFIGTSILSRIKQLIEIPSGDFDEFKHRFEWWESLSDSEREEHIKNSNEKNNL